MFGQIGEGISRAPPRAQEIKSTGLTVTRYGGSGRALYKVERDSLPQPQPTRREAGERGAGEFHSTHIYTNQRKRKRSTLLALWILDYGIKFNMYGG